MTTRATVLKPSIRVKVSTQSKRQITTIPREYADYLGIIEGQTELEVSISDGALVYRIAQKEDASL